MTEQASQTATAAVRFALPSRFLHWLMVPMVIAQLLIGVTMVAALSYYPLLLAIHRPLGVAILAFALAVLLRKPAPMPFTACLAAVFGVSMISNGVFVMGSPLHGLYAIGLAIVVVPAVFAAELRQDADGNGPDQLSLWAAALILIYMWANLTGSDIAAIRGLTQRLGSIIMFGWFSYASVRLLHRTSHAPSIKPGVILTNYSA